MYYPCSENKDADQLRGYREADLRLCFRPCKLLVFSRTGSNPGPMTIFQDRLMTSTYCDKAGDNAVPNVLSPMDLVFRPDLQTKTVQHTLVH